MGGESYYRNNDNANALKLFSLVISEGDQRFSPKAALRAGDIEVQNQNYPQAVRNFNLLYAQSDSKTDRVTGLMRLM
ncbi:MAG TPA: hypothetical protein DCR35_21140, partial [Runella sp.]|nr:hypothetical protein [Runella sp.]